MLKRFLVTFTVANKQLRDKEYRIQNNGWFPAKLAHFPTAAKISGHLHDSFPTRRAGKLSLTKTLNETYESEQRNKSETQRELTNAGVCLQTETIWCETTRNKILMLPVTLQSVVISRGSSSSRL